MSTGMRGGEHKGMGWLAKVMCLHTGRPIVGSHPFSTDHVWHTSPETRLQTAKFLLLTGSRQVFALPELATQRAVLTTARLGALGAFLDWALGDLPLPFCAALASFLACCLRHLRISALCRST